MDRLLRGIGWIQVGSDLSGVFQKNHCYFVMGQKGQGQVVLGTSARRLGVGAELMVHHYSRGWYVEKDGFLLDAGTIGRCLGNAYELGFVGGEMEKAKAFAESIDRYACMSDIEVMGVKKRECPVQKKAWESVRISNLGIGSTNMFVANHVRNPKVLEFFRQGMVYQITAIKGETVSLVSRDGEESADVPLSALVRLEGDGSIVSVAVGPVDGAGQEWEYRPIIQGKQACLPAGFEQFGLSVSQKAALAVAMGAGVNFTPLMDSSLSTGQVQAVLKLMLDGCDCFPLIGKNLPVGQIVFLDSLAVNGLPIDGFCVEGVSVDNLKEKYSSMLEGVSFALGSLKKSPEAKKEITKVAFKMDGYQHVVDVGDNAFRIALTDQKKDPRFSALAEYLLEFGIEREGCYGCTWITMPQEMKQAAKQVFLADGLEIAGRGWNHYLEDSSPKVLSLLFSIERGFMLQYKFFKVCTDRNSLYLIDSCDTVVWRAVYVNQEFFVYHSALVDNLL